MRRPLRFAGATVLLAVAVLAAACTGDGKTSPGGDASWALEGLAAVPAGVPLQGTVDAPPAKGTAKILGIAKVQEADVVLAVRNDTCEVSFLTAPPTETTPTLRGSVGSQRPSGSVQSDVHQGFPGNVLAGKYTQASAQILPFTFVAVGCSEKAMAVRIEGAGASVEDGSRAGDSLRAWRDGQDMVLTVGNPGAIHQPEPGPHS
ncbi:hypothetical protein ACFVFS_24215 [Kitasatospora sp. NPDC057692]|uniref:hypothetical protein n=1 Tax=Kitasatospora sp. NPDC057692 TaxID=3346215 RepID=UPI0036CAFA2E